MAADDDHEWEPFALATLLHVGFSSSKPVGYDATKTVWTYYSYFYPRGRPIKDSVCVAQAGDMLAAPLSLFGELERSAAGVLYSSLLRHRRDPLPRRWGRELLPGGRLPSCFFVDDLFFSAYAAYHRATVYAHPWRRWLFREVSFGVFSRGGLRRDPTRNAGEAPEADGRARVQALRAGWLLAEDYAAAVPRRPRARRRARPALDELPERARGARVVDARYRGGPVLARGFCPGLVVAPMASRGRAFGDF